MTDTKYVVDSSSIKEIRNKLMKEQRQLRIRKLLKNKLLVIGGIITICIFAASLLAPIFFPQGPYEMDASLRLKAPSPEHIFGTDTFGRDVLLRIIYGGRNSLFVGVAVGMITVVLGVILGLYAGFYKKADNIIMRICDGLKTIPSLLLAIALMAVMGSGIKNVIIALSICYTPDIARVARSAVLSAKEQTYVEALRASGAKNARILWKNIFPNIISPVIVQASFIFATSIITEASLSFLGVGVPRPQPSWGNIVLEGKAVIYKAWWMAVYPCLATGLSVLGLNLLGDGLRDFFDPSAK